MSDLFSAIGVLLIFLTMLLSAIEKDIGRIIELRKPEPAQEVKRKQFTRELLKLLLLKTLPVTAIFIVTFYSLLPITIEIVTTSRFSLWHFDELKTIFVFVELGIFGLTIYAIIESVQLVKKLIEK
ncbi:MAG TPA: hypothetical protein VLX91_09145 [Candidatus Acidoferrales bacterium]|nr:hypothetical protein [Candidatus Acidoferrales bacterium]